MNATTTSSPAIEAYVGRCMPFLRDLHTEQQMQLAEDIRQIVGEVAMELEGEPDDLVGPPVRFVAELRTAAGLPPADPAPFVPVPPEPSAVQTVLNWIQLTAVPWSKRLGRDLRPTWWVARGIGLAYLLGSFTNTWQAQGIVPNIQDSNLLGVLGTVALVVASVQFGRGEWAQSRLSRIGFLIAGIASVVALVLAVDSIRYPTYYGAASFDAGYEAGYMESQTVYIDGLPVVEFESPVTTLAEQTVAETNLNLEALPPIIFTGVTTGSQLADPVYVAGDAFEILNQLDSEGVNVQSVIIESRGQTHGFDTWDEMRAFLSTQ